MRIKVYKIKYKDSSVTYLMQIEAENGMDFLEMKITAKQAAQLKRFGCYYTEQDAN